VSAKLPNRSFFRITLQRFRVGLRGNRYQTFKPFPLTQYAGISVLHSSPISGIARDITRLFKDQLAILGGKSRNKCSKPQLAGSPHCPFGLRFRGSLTKGLLIALAISLIPAVAISAQKVTAGSKCKVFKQKVNYLDKTYTCIKSGKYLVWNKGAAVVKPTPLQTPISAPTSKSQSTSTKDISYTPPSVLSDNIELCKIKEVSKSRGMTGAGFPEWNSMTPRSGTAKWALIPIDFPDLPGETNFRQRVDGQVKLLSEWYASVSGGKFKVEWELLDKWVTLPSATSEYAIPLSVNLNDAANGAKLFKDAMNAADPIFDFTNIQTVNFILPKGQTFLTETSQGFPWDSAVKEFKSKEGSISSYSIAGNFLINLVGHIGHIGRMNLVTQLAYRT